MAHSEVARTYSTLGLVERALGNQQRSKMYYEYAQSIERRKRGANHINMASDVALVKLRRCDDHR